MANMDGLRLWSEYGEIAAGVDERAWEAKAAQHLERAIDRKAFGDAAKIDPDITMPKADGMPNKQFDGIE